jgi:transposase
VLAHRERSMGVAGGGRDGRPGRGGGHRRHVRGTRRVKNDERDARDRADLSRLGRLAEARIAPPAIRELRELVRSRAKLVQLRSGSEVPLCSWAGLTPRHRESDTKVVRGGISKMGSRLVRFNELGGDRGGDDESW